MFHVFLSQKKKDEQSLKYGQPFSYAALDEIAKKSFGSINYLVDNNCCVATELESKLFTCQHIFPMLNIITSFLDERSINRLSKSHKSLAGIVARRKTLEPNISFINQMRRQRHKNIPAISNVPPLSIDSVDDSYQRDTFVDSFHLSESTSLVINMDHQDVSLVSEPSQSTDTRHYSSAFCFVVFFIVVVLLLFLTF